VQNSVMTATKGQAQAPSNLKPLTLDHLARMALDAATAA
jgi:hypothetical protein